VALAIPDPHGPDSLTMLRAQRAYLAVNEIDRAILTNSGARLHPFLPLDPFHGVHRAYAWKGIGRPAFVQVNASARAHRNETYEWTWPAAQTHTYDGLHIIATIADPITGGLTDPAWVFPARSFRRVAYLSHPPGQMPQYWVIASPTHPDRFHRYRMPLRDIWRQLHPPSAEVLQTAHPSRWSTRDEGTVYEHLVTAELIAQSRGRLAVYRPAMDIAGRDLLVQLVGTWRTVSVQIKGASRLAKGSGFACLVKRWTFTPSEDFWFGFYFFDVATGSFWKYCWLVPSLEFAALTADQRYATSIKFTVTLEGEENRWRKFRHPIENQVAVLHKALLSLRR
jgi:hypothetical protein